EDDVGCACERPRAVCPDGASGKMMAGRLPVQVVDEELEAGSLHVGGHPAAHGAQPDEPYRHLALGHPFTITATLRSPVAVAQASRVPHVAEGRPRDARFRSTLAPALPKLIDLHDKCCPPSKTGTLRCGRLKVCLSSTSRPCYRGRW